LRPDIRVIAVEPAGADDAYRSFESGVLAPPAPTATIADGLRGALSARTFALIRSNVDGIVTVDEASIVAAMRELWRQLHIIVEPSSAVAFAAVLERKLDLGGAHVGIVLTGGNVDFDALPW
jgi:threonine dehydratase